MPSHTLTLEQKIDIEKSIFHFRSSLPDEERATFDSGHRLSRAQRDAALATLTPEERASRGLRFSDEKCSFQDTEQLSTQRMQAEARLPPRQLVAIKTILMDCWNFADPLWLELVVDAHSHGINMGYNGPRDAIQSAVNMTKTPQEKKALTQEINADIQAGHAIGYFPHPPFQCYRTVPAGLVPKKDGGLRVVKNYSFGNHNSTNALSDVVHCPFPAWDHVLSHFSSAGSDAWGVKWDIEKAYPVLAIRPQDQPLTLTRIPHHGWTYRRAADFGSAVAGFRWEICGGRLLSTLYHIMSYRLSFSQDGSLRVSDPPQPRPTSSLLDPPHRGFCQLTSTDLMIPTLGLLRLQQLQTDFQSPSSVDLRYVARWVDDFVHFSGSKFKAVLVARAILYLHQRYKIPLKLPKFTGVQRVIDFAGLDFISPGATIAVPVSKLQDLSKKLKLLTQSTKVSLRTLKSLVGSIIFFCRAFPPGKAFLAGLFSDMKKAELICLRSKSKSKIPTTILSSRSLSDIAFWRSFSSLQISSQVEFLRSPLSRSQDADAIIHTDWCGASHNTLAAVLLSEGLWTSSVPSQAMLDITTNAGSSISSACMEAFAVSLALCTFGDLLRQKNVLIFVDNIPLIQASYKHYSSSNPLASALRCLSLLQIQFNCHIRLHYVPSASNLADALSRNDFQEFWAKIGAAKLSLNPSPTNPHLPRPPILSL